MIIARKDKKAFENKTIEIACLDKILICLQLLLKNSYSIILCWLYLYRMVIVEFSI